MKFPCLVRPRFCKTPVDITLYGEGLTEYGSPVVIFSSDDFIYCNYQDKAKTVMTAQKKLVEVSGVVLIPGDIVPDYPAISGGYVVVNGVKRDIVRGVKARNPDGTVNFTELDVI